jgi:hypothetical protein
MAAKLDIKKELQAVNNKNYDFYEELTEEEKKAFSPYILMRYVSNPQNREAQEWCIERTNEFVNKNHWLLSKQHKPLLWKLYAGMGLGMNLNYQYLAAGKKEKANKIEKLLAELYPAMKMSEIKILASLMTDKDKIELFDKMGFDKKQRKEYE